MSSTPLDISARLAATVVLSSVPAQSEKEVIGTHSGSFHCDEALATGMLRLLPRFANAPIVRSRDPATLGRCTVLVDVGGKYDHANGYFDHHQGSFTDTYSPAHTIRLSSAGLVFKHFGRDVVAALADAAGCTLDGKVLDKLVLRTYEHFVLELDAIDNGVEPSDGPIRYRISTGLASRVGRLNPAWNESFDDSRTNNAFKEAVALATNELAAVIRSYVKHWLPAREIVQRAMAPEARRAVHASGSIIKLEHFCPWKDHLHEIEAEVAAEEGEPATKRSRGTEDGGADGAPLVPVLYVLYEDTSGSWRIQAVPQQPDSFVSRKPLPAAWRGVRDADLASVSGVAGATFAHASGFIGGAKTLPDVIHMAALAVAAV